MDEGDLVRVRYGAPSYNDGMPGVVFVGGLSTPVARHQGMRLAASLGGGAEVVELDAEGNTLDASPVEPPPAPDADLAALPTEPAPDDAPGVSAAHPAPPAPSASPARIPYNAPPLDARRRR